MRAIILAAGLGRRLAPMGWDRPKCLLPCSQGTLLDNAISASMSVDVAEFVIVVGHRRELVEGAAARHAASFQFVINEQFAQTNTLHSLWLAREYLREDILLFNGDVWFRRDVLEKLVANVGSGLAVEEKVCGDEEVKVITDADGRIQRIGKELPPRTCFGEHIGVGKFSASFGSSLVESLDRSRNVPGSEKFFYEAAIDPLLDRHALTALRIEPGDAIEIDTPEDYEHAQRLWSA